MNIKLKAALQTVALIIAGYIALDTVIYLMEHANPQFIYKGILIGIIGFLFYAMYQIRLLSLESDEKLKEIKQLRDK